ncbi:hypothetical protein LOC67_12335 [Stieleria sp. JC731]|uniref:hypothetical protein n=1 Tax=Pirellulaceae TaxID=2691357 RepID=UPI001E450A8E|nr:hypothetical protein [Stieleria sp. JC731]MCC9601336.1 hypothetical protein [Stieleria sp. JC731]
MRAVLGRDASGRLELSVLEVPLQSFLDFSNEIAQTFSLQPKSDFVTDGAEFASIVFRHDHSKNQVSNIEMAWDHWSGLIITASDSNAEATVQRIHDWMIAIRSEQDDCDKQ